MCLAPAIYTATGNFRYQSKHITVTAANTAQWGTVGRRRFSGVNAAPTHDRHPRMPVLTAFSNYDNCLTLTADIHLTVSVMVFPTAARKLSRRLLPAGFIGGGNTPAPPPPPNPAPPASSLISCVICRGRFLFQIGKSRGVTRLIAYVCYA